MFSQFQTGSVSAGKQRPAPLRRIVLVPTLLASALTLSGCMASLAASALGAAVDKAQGKPQSNEHLQMEARQACSSHAGKYGTTRIIDVEQRSINKIVVWGTVGEGKQRQSFECNYGTKISGFKLRTIGR